MAEISDDTLLTTQQVADYLQCTAPSVINWAEAGKLPVLRTKGGHRRIRVADLVAFLRADGRDVPLELLASKRRIVWIDDDVEFTKSVAKWFKRRPKFAVEVENDPVQGLMTAAAFQPHWIIIDIDMPGLNGFEVVQHAAAHEATKTTQVLFCTGTLTQDVQKQAQELGVAIVGKPVKLAEIAERLSNGSLVASNNERSRSRFAGRASP